MSKKIILSAAHAVDTPGKRSIDGSHLEYKWSRDILGKVQSNLEESSVETILIAPDSEKTITDVWQRVKEENKIDNAFVFSLHTNAAPGDGNSWHAARGVEIYTTKGTTKSDAYATKILNALINEFFHDITHWRTDNSDGDLDKEANFNELMSKHPAVLLEWLFHDNTADVALLNDPAINNRLINCLSNILIKISNEII
ncbi:N-acetylmuramoyl-L-alanine amidase family protein [Viscerimonas tarda]